MQDFLWNQAVEKGPSTRGSVTSFHFPPSTYHWTESWSRHHRQVFHKFINVSLAALNLLDRHPAKPVCGKPTLLQQTVQRRAFGSMIRFLLRFGEFPFPARIKTFADFVRRDSRKEYPEMRADALDSLQRCGQVDVIPHLPAKY